MRDFLMRIYYGFHVIDQNLFCYLHYQTWLYATARAGTWMMMLIECWYVGGLALILGTLFKLFGTDVIMLPIINAMNDYPIVTYIVYLAIFLIPVFFIFNKMCDKNEMFIPYFDRYDLEPKSTKRTWVIISLLLLAFSVCFTINTVIWCYHMAKKY